MVGRRRRPGVAERRDADAARFARAMRSACRCVGGDLEMGATGTVTHIDGDRVYAFGHPVLQPRPDRVPDDARLRLHVLPSLMSSFKISTMGEVIGTMQQDRATAIAGTLGKGPRRDPDDASRSSRRAATARRSAPSRITLVNDQLFTPLLDLRRAVQHAGSVRAPVRRRDLQRSRAARTSRDTAT